MAKMPQQSNTSSRCHANNQSVIELAYNYAYDEFIRYWMITMDSRIEIRPGRTLRIRIYENSHTTKTAFLLHGLGGRGDQWREQINLLKDEYTLIIPDLFGHGNSDKPKPNGTNPYSFSELEQDVQALFHKFENEHNIFIGHSYGGSIATAVALEHQDDIEKLVLIAPTPCIPTIAVPILFRMPETLMEVFRSILEKNFQKLAIDPATSQALIDIELQAARDNPIYLIKAMIEGMQAIPHLDVTMLSIPTLIICGEHDLLILPEISIDFYQAIPHHNYELIKNAAHLIQLEQPHEVNKLIMNFVNS